MESIYNYREAVKNAAIEAIKNEQGDNGEIELFEAELFDDLLDLLINNENVVCPGHDEDPDQCLKNNEVLIWEAYQAHYGSNANWWYKRDLANAWVMDVTVRQHVLYDILRDVVEEIMKGNRYYLNDCLKGVM